MQTRTSRNPAPQQPALTRRELELLKLLSLGMRNREISSRCNITLFTTKWHLKNVFAKLGVTTRIEALFRAQQLRLVDYPLMSGPLLSESRGDARAGPRRNTRKRDLLPGNESERAE